MIYKMTITYSSDIVNYPELTANDVKKNERTGLIQRERMFETADELNDSAIWKIGNSLKRAFVGLVERVHIRPAFTDERIEYVKSMLNA